MSRVAGAKAPTEGKLAPGAQPRRARRRTDKIQLLIVDEHPLLRAGVKTLLENEAGVEVMGEADTVDQAVDACREGHVDVVLMDVDEGTVDAVDGMRRLRDELSANGALVVLARHEDDEGVYRSVVGGAAGHVGADAQPEELVDTIKQAANGGEPISQTLAQRPEVGRRVLEAFAALASRGPVRREPKLTEREISVLSLAAQGQTNQQIGRSLGVSEHTVKSSISQILARLSLRHRTEAVVHALRNGWITTPSVTEKSAAGSSDGRYVRPGF
ncbi:MAG: response regulator transcription factor [Chloroflexota bacterium]